jgi:pectate lyase
MISKPFISTPNFPSTINKPKNDWKVQIISNRNFLSLKHSWSWAKYMKVLIKALIIFMSAQVNLTEKYKSVTFHHTYYNNIKCFKFWILDYIIIKI